MLKEKTSDVSMTNTNQGSGTAAEAAVPMSHGLWNTWRKNLLLFCLTGVYVELCLHLCVFGSMDRYAGYPVLFGLLGGALCTLVVSSLPKVLRQITGVFLVAAQVLLAEVQLVYHCIFGDFMPVSQIGMGGNVVVNFNSQLLYGIRQNLLKILLLLLPLIAVILCLILRRAQVLKLRLRWKQTMASFAVLLALLLTVTGLMYVGRDNAFSVYRTFTNVNTSTDSSYKKIGMLATTAQELRYMLFSGSGSIMITPSSLNISDVPRTYSSNSYNVIESIDFTALADSTDSDILKATDEYLSNATPTRKNNYTGLLKDYNLITICAESFCPWFISEELTPTLYKLSHTGILFEITTARSSPSPPTANTPCAWGFIRICPARRRIPASMWRAPTICRSAWAMRSRAWAIKPGAITTTSGISTTGTSPTPTWATRSRRRILVWP